MDGYELMPYFDDEGNIRGWSAMRDGRIEFMMDDQADISTLLSAQKLYRTPLPAPIRTLPNKKADHHRPASKILLTPYFICIGARPSNPSTPSTK